MDNNYQLLLTEKQRQVEALITLIEKEKNFLRKRKLEKQLRKLEEEREMLKRLLAQLR